MPTSANEIVARMRQALSITEPDLDTSVGTTVRKILDAVSEVVAEASIDTYLLDYQYDIEAKVGADLDDFVSLFGFNRLQAKRATGVVVFGRGVGATTAISIPFGSQIATEDPTPIVVSTLVPALLLPEQDNVSVPVQALLGGGQGNVTANSLRRRVTPLQGIGSMNNPAALTGGADAETDAQLRDRFKRTVFRNLAGTEHMFLATALDHPNVTHANVIGAAKRHREQIEVVGHQGIATLTAAKYVYEGSEVFGPNIDANDIMVAGHQYQFIAEDIRINTLDPIGDGVYDLEFSYVPEASRNDPANGVTNRVDIYVNGVNPVEASETTILTNRQFGVSHATADFVRLDGTHPISGNYFIPFSFGPVIDPSVNGTITIGNTTMTEDEDYWLVNDISAMGGTPTSWSGIELDASLIGALPPYAVVTAEYVYNAVPREVDRAVRVWRLITTDVQVHQAKPMYLNLYFVIMYTPGFDQDGVQTEIERALGAYVSNIGMNGVVQTSDLLSVASRVAGVDAIRFTHSLDVAGTGEVLHYGIERVTGQGNFVRSYSRPVAHLTEETVFSGLTSVYVDSTAGFPPFGSIQIGETTGTYGDVDADSLIDVNGFTGTLPVGTPIHFLGFPSQPLDVLVGEDEYPIFNMASYIQKAQNTFHSFTAG